MTVHDFSFELKDNFCGNTAYIIAAGEMHDFDRAVLKSVIFQEDDLLIAADGGIVSFFEASPCGRSPDVFIGDFDSSDFEKYSCLLPASCEIIRHPVEKDDTDMMLSIKLALSRGYRNIVILGALGGSIYHSVANFQSLKYISEANAVGCIVGNGSIIYSFSDNVIQCLKITPEIYKFSVFALSDKVNGVSIKGAKYMVSDACLTSSFPLGAGNYRTEGETVEIGCKSGTICCIFDVE